MSADKLFTVAGTATNPDGTTKARFANDLVARVKILSKNNCTNINFCLFSCFFSVNTCLTIDKTSKMRETRVGDF